MDIKIYKPVTELDFGKHAGFTIQEVLDDRKERQYITWAVLNIWWFIIPESVYSQLRISSSSPYWDGAPLLQFIKDKYKYPNDYDDILLGYYATLKHNEDLRREKGAKNRAKLKEVMSEDYFKYYDVYADLGLTRIK